MATLEDKLVYLSSKIKAYGIAAGDEEAFKTLVEAIELIQCLSKKKNNWWAHAIEGAGWWNKLDSITTGHTNCEKCNGTGAIPLQTFEPGTMKFDTAWIKCDWCSESVKTCKYCDGTGQIAVKLSVDPKTRESQFGYSQCRNCDGKGYL